MPEFGASGLGFAIHDPEVSDMFTAYNKPRSAYFVLLLDNHLMGGAGVAPLKGAEKTCELQKMYFLPSVRGKGYGQKMLSICVEAAIQFEFEHCYLETLKSMKSAQELYKRNGFQAINNPLGQTGHFGCDAWYLKTF